VISKDDDKTDTISNAFPIAGELQDHGGYAIDAKWYRLSTSKLDTDAGKEGVRLEIKGGVKKVEGKNRKQKAFVEFICDHDLEGDEHLWTPEDEYEGEEPEKDSPGEPSLSFDSYDTSGKDEDVLKLIWRTRHACEDTKREEDEAKKNHWGFFTWFIIMYSVPFSHALEDTADLWTALSCQLLHTLFLDPG